MGRPKGSKNKSKSDGIPDIEIPAPAAAPIPEAPDNRTPVQVHAEKHNFKVRTNTQKLVEVELTGQDSLNSFIEAKGLAKYNEDGHKGDRSFCGGTVQDIQDSANGKFDTSLFLEEKAKLQKQIGSSLECLEAELTRKRTRFMSEHDGELDFDRLYEREPFHNTRITNNGITRVLDVNVMFHFSAGVSSRHINEYGAMTWAIIDILEKAGIRCNVYLNTNVTSLASKDGNYIDLTRYKVRIKGAEEYIDTMDIARHFTSNYFRRVMFNTFCISHESLGHEMQHGLGYPEHWDKKRDSAKEKGVLNLQISQMNDFKLDTESLVKYIRESL
jgi:hypothetical protein